MTDIHLTGLDGSNPLAFLASLGVLVAVDEAMATGRTRLRWSLEGTWRPWLSTPLDGPEALLDLLEADREACSLSPALRFEYQHGQKARNVADVKAPPEVLRAQLKAWTAACRPDPAGRRTVDWFVGFVSEGGVDNNGAAKPTALHFTAAELQAALFGPWAYASRLPVMGWDNTETRDYALRGSDPSTDKKLGNPGADWLALRGLAMLPTAGLRGRQRTGCASGGWKTGRFRWPLWVRPASRAVVASLLAEEGIADAAPSARERRGVGAVLQSRILRSDQGGYGSVTPSTVL